MQATAKATVDPSHAKSKQATIWQNGVFVKMFTAYSLSTFGDWFDMIAIQVLLAYLWKAQPWVMALMPLTFALPGILLGQWAGVLADRTKKRRLMIATDLVSAVLTGILVTAPNVATVLILLTLRSAAGTFNTPAQQALTRQVVAEEHLLKATTWNGMVNQTAKVLGPMGGAFALSLLRPQMCLVLNAVSFLLSAIVLLSIRHRETTGVLEEQDQEQAAKRSFSEDWRAGWQVVLQSRVLWASLLFGLVGLLAVQLVDAQFSVLFRGILPHNEQVVGWSIAMCGFGSVLTIAYLNRLSSLHKYGWLFGFGYLGIGVGFAWMGLLQVGPSLVEALLPGLATGLGNGVFVIGFNYLLQKEPPPEAVGRVSGIVNTLLSAVVIVAPLLGGELVTAFGASRAFFLVGVVVGVIGIIGMVFQRLIWGRSAR